ncbi:NAD(P)H-binding protein [Kribbella amoyensis]|nr:NAD(P)H-binding protein [Kribbella amoyensis]
MTILVLAATGKTGRRVVRGLRERGVEVRAGSRKADPPFDWSDPGSWADVVRGVSAVYLVAPEEVEPVAPFVAQAVAAGVSRFVVLSGRGADTYAGRFGQSMVEAERVVQASGAEWSVIRANNFSQNFDEDLWYAPVLAGRLALPAGTVPEPFVDVEDVAAVAVALLTEDGHSGRVYDVTGPEGLTFADAVARISAATGRPISYSEITGADYAADLRAEGLPEEVVASLVGMFEVIADGTLARPATGVREVLGREPVPFAEYVARVWGPHTPEEG